MSTVLASTTRGPVNIGERRTFTATAQLVHLTGNQRPYFSVQGEERNLGRRGDNQIEACGVMHDQVVRHFPDLAPVIRVHLADDDGVPMYAAENLRYWFGLSTWSNGKPMTPSDNYGRTPLETDRFGLVWSPQTAADHLRVTVDEVRAIRDRVVTSPPNFPNIADLTGIGALIAAEVDALRPRWKAEAYAAMAVLSGGAA